MYFLAPIIIAAGILIFDHVGAAVAALANHAFFMVCAAYLVGAPALRSDNWFRRLACLWVWQVIVGALAALLVMAPWYWASQGWQWGSMMLACLSTAIYFAVCLPYWPGYALSVFPAGRADEDAPAGLNFSEASQLAKISSWKQGIAAVATLLAITIAPLALWYFRDTMANWYYARVALYAVLLAPAAHIFLALGVERTTRHLGSLAATPTMDPVPSPPPSSAEITQETLPEEEPTDDYAAETLLLDSIRTNDLTRIHELLNRGTNPNAEVHTASSVTTPLIAAISDGRTDAVRLLLQAGASATLSRDGLTPIICAVQSGLGSGVVQELIDAGADVNQADQKPSHALHYAAFEGDLDTINVLLKAGAELEAVNNQGHTALLTSCAAGHWDAASALIDAGAAILPDSGQSPLYAASCISSDDPKGVLLLLDKGADVNQAAKLGRTCLMGASLHGNAEIAETLLEAGADINARDDFGISALMEASRSGANRVLERFLFWNPETEHRDKPGRTALLVAASSRRADEETVRLLLAMGADPAVRNREKRLVADLAAGNGRWRIAQMLRDKIEPASQFPPDAEIAQRILEEEVEPPELLSTIDALQEPADSVDAAADAVTEAPSAADLAELEAEIMQARVPSVSELEAMVYSAKILDRESIEADEEEESVDAVVPEDIDAFAEEFMNLARTGDEAELHAFLLQHTGIPEWILSHAFFAAAEAGHQQCASRLLEAGVPANARSETDEPLLTHFCRRVPPALQLIATLIERGADTSADGENAELLIWLCGRGELESYTATGRRTLLTEPEEEGLARVIELAARRGADVNQGDAEGRTPLSWALEYRSPRVVESLLRYGADSDAQMPDNRSALMQACQSRRDVATSLVRLLVKYGGDPHLKTDDGESAFSLAMNDNRETILKFLMMGAGASQPSEVENLVVAAANGTLSTVRRALDAGADPNETDDQGCCALLRAAGSGHYHIVDHLLRHEVELDLPAANGMTALGAAVSAGHLEIVRRLKLAGADIDHQQQQGITPLILAAARGNADMVTLLLDQNAQVDLADDTESTALMAATQNALFSARSEDALETIKRLIKAGANVDTANNDGQTALMLLLGVRAQQVQGANEPLLCEVAELLLDAGANPDQRDLTGWSSMHAAASHGLASPVRLLMEAGANRRQRDINGHSACDLAMEKGHHEVVELFVGTDD